MSCNALIYPPELTPAQLLATGCQILGVTLNQRQQQDLLAYLDLVHTWNQVHNLTRVSNHADAVVYHLLDSLSLVATLNQHHHSPRTIADIGSGMGCPGVVLAICYPNATVTLIDRHLKKSIFLRHVMTQLHLTNIRVSNCDVTSLTPDVPFDVVTSRATAAIDKLAHWCQHLLGKGSLLYAMIGQQPGEVTLKTTALELVAVTAVTVPYLDAPRHIVSLRPH